MNLKHLNLRAREPQRLVCRSMSRCCIPTLCCAPRPCPRGSKAGKGEGSSPYFIPSANSIQGERSLVLMWTAARGELWVCRTARSHSQLSINLTKISTFPVPRPGVLVTGRDWCARSGCREGAGCQRDRTTPPPTHVFVATVPSVRI